MPLIGARMQADEIAQIDQLALAARVPRAIIIRWALRDYVQRCLLAARPVRETDDHGAVVPSFGMYPPIGQAHEEFVEGNDVAFAHEVFDATARARSDAHHAAAWANHDGANEDAR